jgi:hypothetical protein
MKTVYAALGVAALGLFALGLTGCGGGSASSDPITPSFAAERDGDAVAKCFGAYMDLNQASTLAPTNPHRSLYLKQSLIGVKRIDPYEKKAAVAMETKAPDSLKGRAFMTKAVLSHRDISKGLEHAGAGAEREPLLGKLGADADHCDRQLDAWGAAPYKMTDDEEKATGL